MATPARAAIELEDVVIQAEPSTIAFGAEQTYHGYREIRVTLTNRHPSAERWVELRLPGQTNSTRGHDIRRISQALTLAPNTTTTVSLFHPPLPLAGRTLDIRINGKQQRLDVSVDEHMPEYYHHGGSGIGGAVMMSKSVDTNYRNELLRRSGSPMEVGSVFQTELPIQQWSSHWLGYSRYDGVAVTQRDMTRAPAEVADALRRYVSAGGTLVVFGPWMPPQSWGTAPGARSGDATIYETGFGAICTTAATDPNALSSGTHRILRDEFRLSLTPLQEYRSIEDANNFFSVVGELRVPIRGLIILMVIFAVLIGPVNLYVLAKKRRRMWLLWTVPAFSLATCLVIWSVNIFAEGFTARQRSSIVTLLDQRTMTATSLGWLGYYAPLTPGDGLRFSRQTEITPQVGQYQGWNQHNGWSRTVNWGDDQHLTGGWIKARVPAHFKVRKSQNLVRERLTFSIQPDGQIKVVNGLGVDLLWLTYVDDQQMLHTANALAAGESKLLSKMGKWSPSHTMRLRDVYVNDWVGSISTVAMRRDTVLGPGRYVAVIDGPSPFVQPGLKKSDHQSQSVVIGLVDPPTAATEVTTQ